MEKQYVDRTELMSRDNVNVVIELGGRAAAELLKTGSCILCFVNGLVQIVRPDEVSFNDSLLACMNSEERVARLLIEGGDDNTIIDRLTRLERTQNEREDSGD